MKNKQKKTVLITGANSGIGFACVKLFLKNGYKVFAHYNNKKNKLKKINNKNLLLIQANFKNIDEVKVLFDKVLTKTKQINILINNAGLYASVDNLSKLTTNMIDEAMSVNLKAPFVLSQKYIALMQQYRYGRIINISSIGVKYGGSINSMPYTLSKSALEIMTKSFAKEGAKYNILVNALRVGVTNTNIHKNAKNKNMKNRIDMIPLKRMAEPEEIAKYILFLASNKNSFITGSIHSIAGGE